MLVTVFTQITNMGLTIIPIIIIILIARLALQQFAPKIFIYALWAVVLFRLLCPFTIEAPFSAVSEKVSSGEVLEKYTSTYLEDVDFYENDTEEFSEAVEQGIEPVIRYDNESKEYGAYVAIAKNEMMEAPSVKNTIMPVLSVVWLFGIFVLIAYSIITLIQLKKKLVGSVPLQDNIYLADHIDSPFVLGIWKAKIYLPSSLTEHEREYIILHEKHHIKRGDHIVKLLAFIALCIHWMNPLVWLSFFLASKDMEMSCDEAVLSKMGEEIREEYSASLLGLATGRHIISMTPLAFGEGDTKSRIKNVMEWTRPVVFLSVMACIISLFIVGYCIPNPTNDSPDKSIYELTSTLTLDDISEIGCSIYEDKNDVKKTWLSMGAYPGLKSEFVSVLNGVSENEFTLASRYLTDYEVVIHYRTPRAGGYELMLKYNNGVTSFTTDYLNEYSAGTNEEWQTSNVALADFMEKLIEISNSDEPHIRDAYKATSTENASGEWILKTYYEMSDGTYRTDEHSYQYKFSRTGRISDTAAAYTTYIILSNERNITFDQAWKASGLSSNLNDYFDPEDTVIVSIITDKIDIDDRYNDKTGSFSNILGYSGSYESYSVAGYYYKDFYANINGALRCIAETWGTVDNHYSVDIDKDRIAELICNVTYGTGLQQTVIYHREANQIYRGFCDDLLDEEYDNMHYTSEYSYYIPEENVVRIFYYKSDIEDYVHKDYEIDLDRIEFSLYADLGQ